VIGEARVFTKEEDAIEDSDYLPDNPDATAS